MTDLLTKTLEKDGYTIHLRYRYDEMSQPDYLGSFHGFPDAGAIDRKKEVMLGEQVSGKFFLSGEECVPFLDNEKDDEWFDDEALHKYARKWLKDHDIWVFDDDNWEWEYDFNYDQEAHTIRFDYYGYEILAKNIKCSNYEDSGSRFYHPDPYRTYAKVISEIEDCLAYNYTEDFRRIPIVDETGRHRHYTKEEAKIHAVSDVVSDAEHMERWLNNDWFYIGVIAEIEDEDGDEIGEDSLWGVEYDSWHNDDAYIRDIEGQVLHEALDQAGLKDWDVEELMKEEWGEYDY